jgi:hypothetical protein
MPNRIIREGITTSETLAMVSYEAECLFYRLVVVADDFGAFDGRPVIVRAKCLPLRDSTVAQVSEWLRELAEHSLIVQYESEGKPYIAIPKFRQRTRANSAKYPLPDDWRTDDGQLSVNGQSSAHGGGGGGVFVNGGGIDGADPAGQPPAALLPLNDGSEYGVTEAQVREFADLYRAVDVPSQLRAMRGWLIANPANRKTRGGVLRFVTRWLGQEQNKAGKSGSTATASSGVPRGKPAGPSETPLENAVSYARQQYERGEIDSAERDRKIAEATAKHRGAS